MIAEARANVATMVALGRLDCRSIVEATVQDYDDAEGIRALAWQLIGPAFERHLAAQAGWPERTDSDRVTAAFRALDAAGIVAREEFACCQNCGVAEIPAEAETGRGFAFYHAQDAERAARGGRLHIAFGSWPGSPSTAAGIGAEVAAALRAEGLDVPWDGSPDERISVRMTWARRRHGRLAAFLPDDPSGAPRIEVTVLRGRAVPGLGGPAPAPELERLVLPWLPDGVTVRLTAPDGGSAEVHREFDHLVDDGGWRAGRFAGLSLLTGSVGAGAPETGLLDVTFASEPTGSRETQSRPMTLAETLDTLRTLPPRTRSYLSALGRSRGIVQMNWEDERFWLETPDAAVGASTGKFATMAEAEHMLTVLAEEDRVAIPDLPGVITKPW